MAEQDAPVPEQWYPLKLGPTCSDDPSSRFYSLRYEFKPASVDTSRPGSLHNDNKLVTVEFFDNQAGRPKIAFQGRVAEYNELDAVIFFDGESLRLERVQRAVNCLRLIRVPGESSVSASAAALKETEHDSSPPDANGISERITPLPAAEKSAKKPAMPIVRSEKVEAEVPPAVTKPDPPGRKKPNKKNPAEVKPPKGKKGPVVVPVSPVSKKREREPSPVNVEIEEDDDDDASPEKKVAVEEEQIDVEVEVEEVVEEIEEEVSDYEEVDISEDEDGDKTGVDQTAASLKSQAEAGLDETKGSSSSDSSGSGSSESGSGSSESESGSDEEDSASSADDGDDI